MSSPSDTGALPRFLPRATEADLRLLAQPLVGLILNLRHLDPALQGQQLRERVAELIPPAQLFSLEVHNYSTIYNEIRNFLNENGADLPPHSSRLIINQLAYGLYDNSDDKDAAIELAKDLVARGRRRRANMSEDSEDTAAAPARQYQSESAEKVAHNVAMRLKDSDNKFSGELGECWDEYVDSYVQLSKDYNLNSEQKLQYLHNLLSKDALRFYLATVQPHVNTFQQAVNQIGNEYNTAVRQARVKTYLSSLRVSTFTAEGLDMSAALAKVYKTILKLSRQGPPSHRGDAHRIEFLRQAVVEYSWSLEPLQRVASQNLSFQHLYSELEAALLLHRQNKLEAIRSRVTQPPTDDGGDISAGINYVGQGRYARNPRRGGHHHHSRHKSNTIHTAVHKPSPLSVSGCFNCDSPDHMLRDCPRPVNMAKAAARRLEYQKKRKTQNSVHLVLAELCHQMDTGNIGHDSNGEGDNIDDTDIFQGLVCALDSHASINDNNHDSDNDIDDTADILIMQCDFEYSTNDDDNQFNGACVDSGAQLTVIGRKQMLEYCKLVGRKFTPRRIDRWYRFGNKRHRAIGRAKLKLPISKTYSLNIAADVVECNIPFLFGLDLMKRLATVLDFGNWRLTSRLDGWSVPLVNKHGHAYIEWPTTILYTHNELRRIHRHFHHPELHRLFEVMKRGAPDKARPEDLSMLEEITRSCDVCQKHADAPHRFRVAMPSDTCTFNRLVSIDLMSLDKCTVVHVVDVDTKFGAASFTADATTRGVWKLFEKLWVTPYLGYPDILAYDQGPQFSNHTWKNLLLKFGITPQPSGVESHNALGVNERYHAFLRKVYQKIRDDNPELSKEHALSLAVKAVNDTAGPHGLVPTLLVFGSVPRLPIKPEELPEQNVRIHAMITARKEMSRIAAQSRLEAALRRNVPHAADADVRVGDLVLMFREKPVGKWVGPYSVTDMKGKQLTLNTGDRFLSASVDKVKLYEERDSPHTEQDAGERHDDNNDESAAHERQLENIVNLLRDKGVTKRDDNAGSDRTRVHADVTPVATGGTLMADLDKLLGNEQLDERTRDSALPIDTFVVKILKPSEDRAHAEDFRLAKLAEVNGLKSRRLWKKIKLKDRTEDGITIGGRFILTLKNYGTPAEKAKVRYVAQGFNDREQPYIVHDMATLRASSIRLILSTAAYHGFRLFSHDVTQAYLQSKYELSRQIYIQPKKEDMHLFGLQDGELLQLIKPLYGICEAGDYWGITIDEHLINDLGMISVPGDSALYVKVKDDAVIGVTGSYVDDSLNAGHAEFVKLTDATLQKFESKDRVYDTFDFYGAQIDTVQDGNFKMSQRYYIRNLCCMENDATFEEFSRHRALFSWLSNTRPDAACAANKAAQVTPQTFCVARIKELNAAIKKVKATPEKGLLYGPLDVSTAHIRIYTDASFASNADLSSQIGTLVTMCDNNNQCHILDFKSKKSKRIVRSIMAGEVCAFMDGFDQGFAMAADLELLLRRRLQIYMFTDSKQLFDAMTKGKHTTERRLMVDILAARQSYRRFEIDGVALVRGDVNPADALSKIKGNRALADMMETGIDSTPVEQWIERDKLPSKDYSQPSDKAGSVNVRSACDTDTG